LTLGIRHSSHDDGDRASRLLGSAHKPRVRGEDHVNLHADELGRQRSGAFFSTFGVAAFDPNVLAFHETLSAELLEDCIVERRNFGICWLGKREPPYSVDFPGLLRLGSQRLGQDAPPITAMNVRRSITDRLSIA